ncbi:hypothetical protein ACCT18_05260 [Rhizobium ruizarguesonis]
MSPLVTSVFSSISAARSTRAVPTVMPLHTTGSSSTPKSRSQLLSAQEPSKTDPSLALRRGEWKPFGRNTKATPSTFKFILPMSAMKLTYIIAGTAAVNAHGKSRLRYRHDIDGNAIAPITADDRIAAQLAFSKLKNNPTEGPSPAILEPDLVRYRDQRRQGHARNVTNCFAPNLLILKVNDPRHPKLPPSDLKDLQAMPAGRRSTWI